MSDILFMIIAGGFCIVLCFDVLQELDPYFSIFLLPFQLDALTHPFFDELRDPNTRLPNGRFLPPLFNFKSHGRKFLSN